MVEPQAPRATFLWSAGVTASEDVHMRAPEPIGMFPNTARETLQGLEMGK